MLAAKHGAALLRLPEAIRQASRVKRSAYSIANWFIASFQWCAAFPQSAVILRNASQISLLAASSLGKSGRAS
jgi:hypothetical protein